MDSYDYNTLECRLKAAQAQLRAFRSGAKYQELQALRAHDAAHYNRLLFTHHVDKERPIV